MKIEGIGNYQGTITKAFKIAPKKASLKKVKSGKKNSNTLYHKKWWWRYWISDSLLLNKKKLLNLPNTRFPRKQRIRSKD